MKRSHRVAKLVAVNCFVLLTIVWSCNLIASALIDGQRLLERSVLGDDDRAALPSYNDKEHARAVLRDFQALETDYAPFLGWTRRPYQGETTTIDERGDRVHAPRSPQPRGAVRFFGGSTMWGSGVDDEATIPALFNDRFPELRVTNHGESGYTSRQNLARLVNLVNQGEPMDLVVFYDGNNDVGTFCRSDVDINGHTRANRIQQAVNPSSFVAQDLLGSIQRVLDGKFVRKHIYRRPYRPSRCADDPGYRRLVAETMLNNWEIARAVARVGGADFLAVLQPVASTGRARVDHLDPDDFSRERDHARIFPIVRELVRERGLDWVLDLSDAYDVDEYIYIDDCHANEIGHRIIAERLAAQVGPRLESLVRRRADSSDPSHGAPAAKTWRADP